MISDNEDEAENEKYITQIRQGLDMDTNMLNIKCVSIS